MSDDVLFVRVLWMKDLVTRNGRVYSVQGRCVGSVEYDSICRRGTMLLAWNVYSTDNRCVHIGRLSAGQDGRRGSDRIEDIWVQGAMNCILFTIMLLNGCICYSMAAMRTVKSP